MLAPFRFSNLCNLRNLWMLPLSSLPLSPRSQLKSHESEHETHH